MPYEIDILISGFFTRHNKEKFIKESSKDIDSIAEYASLKAKGNIYTQFEQIKSVRARIRKEREEMNMLTQQLVEMLTQVEQSLDVTLDDLKQKAE